MKTGGQKLDPGGVKNRFSKALVLLRRVVSASIPRRPVYVQLELTGSYPEHRPRSPWWSRRQPESVDDIRRRLELMRATPAVTGVVLMVRDVEAGLASIQSLRSALAAYRASGGRVVAYLPQASTRLYYLASVADAIVMPESGTLDLVGLTVEATFMGGGLSRLGIAGEFERIGEYKSAVEPFTRDSMSGPMREALDAVLDSVFEDVVTGIAASRRLDAADVRRLIDRAPLSAGAARDGGLVDALLFEDELPEYLTAGARRRAIVLPWALARRRLRQPFRWRVPGRAIAVISARGLIQMGESRGRSPVPIPFVGSETTGHATITRAVRAVERNALFGAIILSVDSPGGSALASDLIWREVRRVGRAKPVVAFLENVAASGGYYIAAGARRIVSQPGCITGSIGVISGKFNVRGLAERAGVHREILARGEVAAIASPFLPFSAEERRRLRAQAEEFYDRFVERVAAGRGMPREAVLAAARGRVWTGRQARRHGLVDVLGDFTAAVAAAKELMGVPPWWRVFVVQVRPPKAVRLAPRGPMAIVGFAAGIRDLLQERVLALMPWEVSLR